MSRIHKDDNIFSKKLPNKAKDIRGIYNRNRPCTSTLASRESRDCLNVINSPMNISSNHAKQSHTSKNKN